MKTCSLILLLLAAVASAREIYSRSVTNSTRPRFSPALSALRGDRQQKATIQYLDCFDYQNQGGERLRAIDYIPALYNNNFDNRISSCCFTGIWIVYADEDYNERNTGAANWWAYGNGYCTNVPAAFDNVASSLRYTGAPDGWEFDTLNLYFNDFFIGGEEFLYNDASQLNYDNRARSVIVTGCSAWTLYQYNNYQGERVCVWPANTGACYPGFYTTSQALGPLAGQVSSARRGCYAAKSVLPDNYEPESKVGEEGKRGASGFFPARPQA